MARDKFAPPELKYEEGEEMGVREVDWKNSEIVQNAKVLVGTPNYTNVFSSETHCNHVECATSWGKWDIDFNMTVVGRTFVHFARTQMCEVAERGGFTHIFWLDDDAVVDPNMLPRLIEHDKEIVIAPYPMRRYPHAIGVLIATSYICLDCQNRAKFEHDEKDRAVTQYGIGYKCDECGSPNIFRDFHNHSSYMNITVDDLGRGLIEVDGGGTHAMLMKTEVFHKKSDGDGISLYPPDLEELVDTLRRTIDEKQMPSFDRYLGDLPDESLSLSEENEKSKPFFIMPKSGTEDMQFCYRARRKGVEVWCDTNEFASHVGFTQVVTKEYTEHAQKRDGAPDKPPIGEKALPIRADGIHQARKANLV